MIELRGRPREELDELAGWRGVPTEHTGTTARSPGAALMAKPSITLCPTSADAAKMPTPGWLIVAMATARRSVGTAGPWREGSRGRG